MTSKLEHALALARDGYYVFPCDPETNIPTVPWRERSTRNPDTIKDWWMCPFLGFEQDWNIGVDCSKSGVTAVDVDVKNGKQGRASFEKWQDEFGWGVTRMQITTTSGMHLIYKAAGFKNSVEKLAPGIDVRGDGGYYIAAGSTKNGKEYILEHNIAPIPLPAWLEEKLTALGKAEPISARQSGKTIIEDNADDIAAAIEFLQSHPPAIEGDAGDIHTYVTFCKLKERGVSIQTAIDLVIEHWNPNCTPPWSDDDLIAKANSAYAHAHNATGAKSPHAEFDIPKEQATEPKHTHNYAPGWIPKKANQIPRRQWVIPGIAQKGKVTLIVSEPGVGKSILTLGTMLSKASGKKLMGFDTGERGACAVFNNEDDVEEMERRLVAYMQHHTMPDTDLYSEAKSPLMFINSGEMKRLRIAKRLKDGTIAPDAVQSLIAYVLENNIQLLIVDPFAETHPAQENSNEDIGTVAAMFRHVAQKGNCAVILVHHTKKPTEATGKGGGGDMNLSRGASSLLGVARSVWTLTNMTEKDAQLFGIPESERHLYVVFEQAKANMAAPGGNKKYFKRVSVTLYLALDDIDGESVGILEPANLKVVNARANSAQELVQHIEDIVRERETSQPELIRLLKYHHPVLYADIIDNTFITKIKRLFPEGVCTGNDGVMHRKERKIKESKTPVYFISHKAFNTDFDDVI